MPTTFIFRLKIDFVVIATTIVNIIIAITIADIIIHKFDFIIMNMCFIFAAINTHYTTSKFKKTLKAKNKRSIENLNKVVFIENLIYIKS